MLYYPPQIAVVKLNEIISVKGLSTILIPSTELRTNEDREGNFTLKNGNMAQYLLHFYIYKQSKSCSPSVQGQEQISFAITRCEVKVK